MSIFEYFSPRSARKKISWQKKFSSLCDSPVEDLAERDLDDEHPALLFHHYWTTLPRRDGLPLRRAFKPAEIPAALPWILAFDAQQGPQALGFQVRLHGTKAVDMTHGDFTGCMLEEFVTGDCLESRRRMLSSALEQKRAVYGMVKISSHCEYITNARMGVFPFVREAPGQWQVFVVVAQDNVDLRRLM